MAFTFANLYCQSVGFPGDPSIFSYSAVADSFATVATAAYFNTAVNTVKTGDRIFVSTTTANLCFSGTFLNDGTNVSVSWDRVMFRETQMNDISAAETIYLPPMPNLGVITQVYGTQFSAITVASSIVTFSIGATAITGGTLTITTAGIAGQTWTAAPTALNITDGSSSIKIVSDGGGTTTARGVFGVKVICPTNI